MKKNQQILFITSAVLVSGFLAYLLVWSQRETDFTRRANKSPSNNANASVRVDSIPKLLDDERESLESKIENWSLYRVVSTVYLGSEDCPATENRKKLDRFNAGSKRVLTLNEGYKLIETSNYYSWDQSDMESFAKDPGVICAVASYYPFKVYPDRVLWRMSCGGADVDPTSPSYPQFKGCIQAEEVVNSHFGIKK